MDLTAITFGLSLVGYALVTARMAGAVSPEGRRTRIERLLYVHGDRIARLTGFVIVAHVYLIWSDRFGWDFERSLRSGWVNWFAFHGAFVLVLLMTIAPKAGGHARKLLIAAWIAVTPGVSGAPFVYPFLGALKIPILALVACGLLALASALARRRRPPAA